VRGGGVVARCHSELRSNSGVSRRKDLTWTSTQQGLTGSSHGARACFHCYRDNVFPLCPSIGCPRPRRRDIYHVAFSCLTLNLSQSHTAKLLKQSLSRVSPLSLFVMFSMFFTVNISLKSQMLSDLSRSMSLIVTVLSSSLFSHRHCSLIVTVVDSGLAHT
jgi:hypothetical protein